MKLMSSPDASPRSPRLLQGVTPSYSSHQTRARSPVPWLHGQKKDDESEDRKGLPQIATPQNENGTSSSNVTPTSEGEGSISVSHLDVHRLNPPPIPLRPPSTFHISRKITDDISSLASPSNTESFREEEKASGGRRRDSVPFKKPRDFPDGEEFKIKPRIAQIESKLFSLDEKTLKQFDVNNQRGRKTKRSHTAPAAVAPQTLEDDWWGTASAPSEHGGSDHSEVVCEFFNIGSPTTCRSRASSVCSLGSLYSTRSSKSSRSMKSMRSYVSTGSIYKCSSAGSIYSSDGSLYGDD